MKDIKIINFSKNGGIMQFSNYLKNYCFKEKDIINSNSFFEVYKYIKKHKNNSLFIFTNNNIKVHLFLLFLKFDAIVILHDHIIRKNSSIKEKLQHYLIYKNLKKFKKIIIHENNNDILNTYSNIEYAKMPYHNGIKIDNENKINLLFFGRIEPYKNLDFFINVMNKKNIKNKFNLIIAGKGNINDESLEIINKNENISILNQFIDDQTRDLLIDWSHYFILPYNSITQTGIIDMAGYYGKPSIISNIPQFKEYSFSTFNNIININNEKQCEEDLIKIYINFSDTYNDSQKEAYQKYTSSLKKWSIYKQILEKDL